jgi:hypothetical protein
VRVTVIARAISSWCDLGSTKVVNEFVNARRRCLWCRLGSTARPRWRVMRSGERHSRGLDMRFPPLLTHDVDCKLAECVCKFTRTVEYCRCSELHHLSSEYGISVNPDKEFCDADLM